MREKEIQDGRRRVKRRIPDIETEKAVADLNYILMDQRGRKYKLPLNNKYLIVGHTHVKDDYGSVWNLGCWEKDQPHWYLIVNGIGEPDMIEWK